MLMNKEKQKIVPQLRFPEFVDNGEWKSEPLGKFADVSKLAGYEFTKHIIYEDEGKIIALRGLNIKNNKLDLTNVKYIDNSELSKLTRSKLYVDDLMFTYIGTIGEVALIEENDKYYLAPNVSRIRLNKEVVLPNFILQYFNTTNFKKIEVVKYISSSSQPALTMGNVRKFSIALPPSKKEQQKIANCLSSLDNLITAETEKLNHLKDHKKGLLQQLFPANGETKLQFRFPEFKNDGEWEEIVLDNLGEIVTGKTPSTKNESLWNGEVLFITPTDISDKKYQKSTKRTVKYTDKLKILPKGSIVFTCIASIGKMAMTTKDSITNQQINSIVPDEYYENEFIYYLLISLTTYIKSLPATSTLPIINKTQFSEIQCKIPKNPKEQQKIANCLSSADDLIAAQKTKIENLKKHKKGLMQQLFPNINEVAV